MLTQALTASPPHRLRWGGGPRAAGGRGRLRREGLEFKLASACAAPSVTAQRSAAPPPHRQAATGRRRVFALKQRATVSRALAPFLFKKNVRRPVSRVLFRTEMQRRSFIWTVHRWTVLATYPDVWGGEPCEQARATSLFGLAPGGACHAVAVTRDAVGSYPTLSPLPVPQVRRFAFCGAIPRVTPGGRYPPPFHRGARTFLDRGRNPRRDRPAV